MKKKQLTLSEMAALGGKARWAHISKQERSVIASENAHKSWITRRKNAGSK